MKRFVKITALALAGTLLASTATFALDSNSGSPEDRAACTGDAFRVCGQYIPNADAVAACLKKNVSKLSPACKKVMTRK